MAKPKSQKQFRGNGNKHNRFKRDSKRLGEIEKKGKPAGWQGLRWQGEDD
jgi:hypothetical protein